MTERAADQPIEGYYRMKLRRGAHPVGVRVWYGAPLDPVTREELDRGHRWQATINNRDIDLDRVWPLCAGARIDRAEHDYLAGLQDWAEDNAPESPQANPFKKIDPLTAPLPF